MTSIERYGNKYIHKNNDICTIYHYKLELTDEQPIIVGSPVLVNDTYKEFLMTAPVNLRLIQIGPVKYKPHIQVNEVIKYETYEDYLRFKSTLSMHDNQWVYNILEGMAEKENILIQTKYMTLVRNIFKWVNISDLKNLAYLGIIHRKDIASLRDLDGSHINLLETIMVRGLDAIYEYHGVNSNQIKCFIHYRPSTWHLHVHFVHILSNYEDFSCVTGSHLLQNVIFNLKLDSNYYKKIIMPIFQKNE